MLRRTRAWDSVTGELLEEAFVIIIIYPYLSELPARIVINCSVEAAFSAIIPVMTSNDILMLFVRL